MAIEVLKPGLSTSVQDLGRPGYYHLGIPLSGGMDRYALRVANLLVGNAEDAAVLEAVFMGPELRFGHDAMVAVTGAELAPRIDGAMLETWASFMVKAGQVLQTLPDVHTTAEHRTVPPSHRRLPAETAELRVLPGLYWHRLTEAAGAGFFADTWKVAPEADRIGYRFRGGHPLAFNERTQPFGAGSDPSNIVDSCYPYGSIQVPGGTEPIVLHRDAVSGGGYFMLGTVISADMDLIGQLQPHAPARFVAVDMPGALAARHERQALLAEVRAQLA